MDVLAKPRVLPIWPDGAPGSESWTHVEKESVLPPDNVKIVRNVSQPTLTVHRPVGGVSTGTAVVVCPGGAFHFLADEHEGIDVADWLVHRGVTALVLRYRVVPTASDDKEFQAQLRDRFANRDTFLEFLKDATRMAIADGRQAMQVARRIAPGLGVAANRIGIMGFSAGGVVATGVALQHDADSRPDFFAPIYGAPWEDVVAPADAAPLFIALAADDDMAVRSSLPLFSKWRDAGQPAELHVYSRGGHGFGMRKQGLPVDGWIDRFGDWLDSLGLLKAV